MIEWFRRLAHSYNKMRIWPQNVVVYLPTYEWESLLNELYAREEYRFHISQQYQEAIENENLVLFGFHIFHRPERTTVHLNHGEG